MRVGGLLFPEGQLDLAQDTPQTAEVVLEAAMAWWPRELERAEKFAESDEWRSESFGQSRPSLRELLEALERLI